MAVFVLCEICGWGRADSGGTSASRGGTGQAAELFEQKIKPPEVAQRLRVSVSRLISGTGCGGTAVIRPWHPAGRADHGAVCPRGAWRSSPCILEEGPAAHGWVEDQVWTAARVATLIGRKFHVSYSVSGAPG